MNEVLTALQGLAETTVSWSDYVQAVREGRLADPGYGFVTPEFESANPGHPLIGAQRFPRMEVADTVRDTARDRTEPFPAPVLELIHGCLLDCCAAVRLSLAQALFHAGDESSLPALDRLSELENDPEMLRRSDSVRRCAQVARGRCVARGTYHFPAGQPILLCLANDLELAVELQALADESGLHLYQSHSAIDLIALTSAVQIVDLRVCAADEWQAFRTYLEECRDETTDAESGPAVPDETPLILVNWRQGNEPCSDTDLAKPNGTVHRVGRGCTDVVIETVRRYVAGQGEVDPLDVIDAVNRRLTHPQEDTRMGPTEAEKQQTQADGGSQSFAPFSRATPEAVLDALKAESLFATKLVPDIEKARGAARERRMSVFPALRHHRVDFYYRGGKLFSYDKAGFRSHIKYASVLLGPDYVRESDLGNQGNAQPIHTFAEGYERIKENCAHYAGVEAAGVADIYSRYPHTLPAEDVVVLDIEVALMEGAADDEDEPGRYQQNRVDLLLYDQKSRKLMFVEAKHYTNPELKFSAKNPVPKVVHQARRYANCLADPAWCQAILNAYKAYVKRINRYFRAGLPDLPEPEAIYTHVPVFVFGFDRLWQGKNAANLRKALEHPADGRRGVPCHYCGNTGVVSTQQLWTQLKRAIARVKSKEA